MTVRKRQDRRPGEIALINTIQSGAIDRVLVWSIDRIGKSLVELVGFLEVCRRSGVLLWVDERKLDTATLNGLSLFDLSTMMASHLRQSRRDRIIRGQAAARSLSIRFGRPPLTKPKVEKAKQFLAAGKGVRESARTIGRHFFRVRLQNQDLNERRGRRHLTPRLPDQYSMNRPAGPGKWSVRVCKVLTFSETSTVTGSARYRSMAPSRSWLTDISPGSDHLTHMIT